MKTKIVLIVLALLIGPHNIWAQAPSIENVYLEPPSAGNPGANIYSIDFSDGMTIYFAEYQGQFNQDLSPVLLVPGYRGSMGYLHPFAKHLVNNGIQTLVIQPPGQGSQGLYSGINNKKDGYEYTIEGLATMYLPQVLKMLATEQVGRKVSVMGHSRGGYVVRALASGYQFKEWHNQQPVIQPYNLETLESSVDQLYSLLSPLEPDDELIGATQSLFEMQGQMDTLEKLVLDQIRPLLALTDLSTNLWNIMTLGSVRRTHLSSASPEELSQMVAKPTAEFLMGTDGPQWSLVDLARRNRQLAPYIQSDDEIERGLQLARDLIAKNPSLRRQIEVEDLAHVISYFSKSYLPLSAHEEFVRIAGIPGESSSTPNWNTYAVKENGKPLNFTRAIYTHRKRGEGPPLHLIQADDDGGLETHFKETEVDTRSQQLVVKGGHGGALYIPAPRDEIIQFYVKCHNILRHGK